MKTAHILSISVAASESLVIPYLNRLSSLLWAAARWQEDEAVAAKPWRTT